MSMAPRLELRQGQALVMTPQLQQAIKLLAMTNLELTAFVEQEVERNPLLERDEGDGPSLPTTIDTPPGGEAAVALPEATDLRLALDSGPPDSASELDTDLANVYADAGPADGDGLGGLGQWNGKGGDPGFDDGENALETLAEAPKSLRAHLFDQLSLATEDPATRLIGGQLIELIDDAGYLSSEWTELAARLGISELLLDSVLKLVQGFDPTGCAARNLRECLALQLKEQDRLDPCMEIFLDHLDLLARRDMAGLMRQCGCDAEDLAGMVADLKRLNPKPGLAFTREEAETLIPDVLVRRAPDGSWTVELNAETLPRVLVNQRYMERVSAAAQVDKKTRNYLTDCLASANWLARSLDQRARTILKVASEIVRFQDRFLTHGVQHLRPLTLKAVADAIEMHEFDGKPRDGE